MNYHEFENLITDIQKIKNPLISKVEVEKEIQLIVK